MSPERREHDVVIVGAGLVGSLLGLFLARRGHDVTVYEARSDLRRSAASAGRSINLVLTARGIRALATVGLQEQAEQLTVPVLGRMMHSTSGDLQYQPYGRDDSEFNHSIPRGALNCLLMSAAERRGVQFHFDTRLCRADLENRRLEFHDTLRDLEVEVGAGVVFGTDGAASAVRSELVKLDGFSDSSQLLEHGYKELHIPPAADGSFRLAGNALHIWPRGRSMLMALPNVDGSFTVTLYLPYGGPGGFDELDTESGVLALFERQFPDAIPLIEELGPAYFRNPTGKLGTVRCFPWHDRGNVLLLGDASHAIVPFFGQGMNSGFEDCTVLERLIDLHGGDGWERVFSEFDTRRKPNTEAIADMALENFVEMCDRVGDDGFLLMKAVERRLERAFPDDYRSRYSMVMYSSIPYRDARDAGLVQEKILEQLCRGIDSEQQLDLDLAARLIRDELTPFLESRSIDLGY